MLSSIKQGAATDGAHNYGPGTHLYPWVERGTICVNTLPKDAILKRGQCWFRTHDPSVVSPTPYHYAIEAIDFMFFPLRVSNFLRKSHFMLVPQFATKLLQQPILRLAPIKPHGLKVAPVCIFGFDSHPIFLSISHSPSPPILMPTSEFAQFS